MADPVLTLGAFDLTDAQGNQTKGAAVIAEGTSRGHPVPLEVAVKSWLQDGAIVVTQGYDNREVAIRVRFSGADLVALADLEAALFAELGKPNTLTWTPPDGLGPPSVFNVVTSSMQQDDTYQNADLDELRNERTYVLRLICEAFVRSEDEVVAEALPASGDTTELVDDGTSTSGWSGAVNGTSTAPGVSSGAVGITTAPLDGTVTIELTRTALIDTSTTKYLQVDWAKALANDTMTAQADGATLSKVSEGASPTAGLMRTTFYVPGSSVSAVKFTLVSASTEGGD